MYSAKLAFGVPPPEILTAFAHSGDLITEELLCTDGQAVDKVAEALPIQTVGRETTGSLLVENFLGDFRLTRFGWYAPAVIHPFSVLD
ncbi:MAG: hypothetical protein GY866_38000 [Proteobacteria bacterium]|nr:hypothetical protein [Pseudomonadota bacterium]